MPLNRGPLILSASFFGLAVALAGWAVWPQAETSWERVQRTGSIRVAYTLEEPYAFRDSHGRVTGEGPEVAREVLRRMGIRHVEWVHVGFGVLVPHLQSGRFDIVAAGMFRTPVREREIDFSVPTYCTGPGLLVPAGNAKGLRDYPDFARRTDLRLAVLAGAIERGHARQAGIPEARLVTFPDAASAARGVRAGVADALALTAPSVRALARAHPGLEALQIVAVPPGAALSGCGAFGFRKDDVDLRQAFDRQLRRYLGSTAHLEQVHRFGFTRQELPPGLSGDAPSR